MIDKSSLEYKLKALKAFYLATYPYKVTNIMYAPQQDLERLDQWIELVENNHNWKEEKLWNNVMIQCNKLYKHLIEKNRT